MTKIKLFLVFALLALLMSVSIGAAVNQGISLPEVRVQATATLQPPTATPQALGGEDLQPGVREFIANTYLAHTSQYPDPNEPVELLRLYLEGRQLLRQGQVEETIALFT